MPKITFSHPYPKLEAVMASRDRRAQLLLVQPIELSTLPAAFIEYDTGGGIYPLPKKGAYMLLLFRVSNGLFPTLRRWTPNKYSYYSQLVGQEFDVVIEGQRPMPDQPQLEPDMQGAVEQRARTASPQRP